MIKTKNNKPKDDSYSSSEESMSPRKYSGGDINIKTTVKPEYGVTREFKPAGTVN